MTNIDLTTLCTAVLTILGGLLTRHLIPWLRSRTTARQREDLLAWSEIAVQAAQQLLTTGSGAAKQDLALSILRSRGYNVEDAAVKSALEAQVLRLKTGLMEGSR